MRLLTLFTQIRALKGWVHLWLALACLLASGCDPAAMQGELGPADKRSSAQPGCCSHFENALHAAFPDLSRNLSVEDKIAWVARERPEKMSAMRQWAIEELEGHRPSSAEQAQRYDLILIGGGPFAAILNCNVGGGGCSRRPRTLVISESLGGPFSAFGSTFYLNTREREGAPEESETLLPGCPVQLYPFVTPRGGEPQNAMSGIFEGTQYWYPEGEVLGDATLFNHMLMGSDVLLGSTVPNAALRRVTIDGEPWFEITMPQGTFRAPRVVIASGHGKPYVPATLASWVESERSKALPRVEVLDDFLTRASREAARGNNMLALYRGKRMAVAGGSDGASIAIEFLLGSAPPAAYAASAPGEVGPLLPILQYGQKHGTKERFLEELRELRKQVRYRAVAEALEKGDLLARHEQAVALRLDETGSLEVGYGSQSAVDGWDAIDHLILSTGYDPAAGYALFASERCPEGASYRSWSGDTLAGQGADDPLAQVAWCGDEALEGLYLFIPRGLVEKANQANIRTLGNRAAGLGQHLGVHR